MVAEGGVRSQRKERCGPPCVAVYAAVTDGENAAVNDEKPALCDAVADGTAPESQFDQLRPGNVTRLQARELGDRDVERTRSTLGPYVGPEVDRVGHAVTLAAKSCRVCDGVCQRCCGR